MKRPPNAQFSHLGFQVRDIDRMIDFYTRVMGMVLNDRGPYYMGGEIAFLSRNSQEHHQVVFASGRGEDGGKSILNQISFRLDSLEDLKTYDGILKAEGVKGYNPKTHGNAWSIYFEDPEGNRIELYAVSPWFVNQPWGKPLDLTEPVETIMEKTWALVKDDPTLRPMEQWIAETDARIRG